MARREHPRYENTEWPEYEFREFPLAIYPGSKDGGKTPDPDPRKPGKFLQEVVIVQDEAERRAVLGLDAIADEAPSAPRAAVAPKLVPTSTKGVSRVATEADDRQSLLEQCEVKGIQVDKTWSIARIQSALDEAAQEVV